MGLHGLLQGWNKKIFTPFYPDLLTRHNFSRIERRRAYIALLRVRMSDVLKPSPHDVGFMIFRCTFLHTQVQLQNLAHTTDNSRFMIVLFTLIYF
jgi:hypothetical protein